MITLSRDVCLRPIPDPVSTVPATALAWAGEAEADDAWAGRAAAGPSISPELVLVDPDLREVAVALLPDRAQDGWIPPPYVPPPAPSLAVPSALGPPALVRPAGPPAATGESDPRHPPLALSVAVYTLESAAHAALLGGVIVALMAAFAVAADVLHP